MSGVRRRIHLHGHGTLDRLLDIESLRDGRDVVIYHGGRYPKRDEQGE
jgi:hypothetical protein